LFRKELREHRQQLVVLSAFVVGVLLLAWPFGASTVLDVFYLFIALYYPALAGLFVATRVATGERTAGTREFVRSLPVALPTVAGIRLTTGLVVCAAPILLATMVVGIIELCSGNTAIPIDRIAQIVMGGQMSSLHVGPLGAVVYTGVLSTVSTVLVFLWSCVASVRQPNETRAGVASVCVLTLWLILSVTAILVMQNFKSSPWLTFPVIVTVAGLGPGAGLGLSKITSNSSAGTGLVVFSHLMVVLIQACVLTIVVRRFCNDYGNDRNVPVAGDEAPERRSNWSE
jgi:hypothetical protein